MKTFRIRFLARKIGQLHFRQFTVKVLADSYDSAYAKLSDYYEHISNSRQIAIL